ncbi:hypothetical protein RchiOBHm_Chr6g0292671 [Rosa chinensis]|uniref:Uncharacterized protein n=1 Tax=Rosa chinensis TaxID=74649 RepID=A0A2P6PWF4_ROSCH|nr:hypothetical protein RchiOBHm_Chr6g0292671 [Rosa chinensis]
MSPNLARGSSVELLPTYLPMVTAATLRGHLPKDLAFSLLFY